MVNRSNFPTSVDTFNVLVDILASDKTNVERYQTLLMQETRTSAEETEFTNLKNTLKNKIISAEQFNFLADSITSMQQYYLEEVVAHLATLDVGALRTDVGLPTNLITTVKSNVVAAVNEVQSEINSHNADKNNPHNTTASQVGAYTKTEADNTFAKKQQPSWFDLVLIEGWVNTGGGFATAQYMKDELGFVHIKGVIQNGTTAQGSWIAAPLPVGYRPSETLIVNGMTALGTSYSGDATFFIGSDGVIMVWANVQSGQVSLNFPPYKAV